MSSSVVVNTRVLRPILATLSRLVPSGSTTIPIGIHVKDGMMTIVCVQGCLFQRAITVEDTDILYDATVIFRDVTALLEGEDAVEFQLMPVGVSLKTASLHVTFPMGYSTVELQQFPTAGYKTIQGVGYHEGLRVFKRAALDKLEKRAMSIKLDNGVALQKYPNVWIASRVSGMPINAVFEAEHIQLIDWFSPTEVYTEAPGSIVLKNKDGYLQIPCTAVNDTTKITDLMQDLSEPVRVKVTDYMDKLTSAQRMLAQSMCHVTVTSDGFLTRCSAENISVELKVGECSGAVIEAFDVPIQLWISTFKAINSDVLEILVGGGKVCLRTAEIIMLLRVL